MLMLDYFSIFFSIEISVFRVESSDAVSSLSEIITQIGVSGFSKVIIFRNKVAGIDFRMISAFGCN